MGIYDRDYYGSEGPRGYEPGGYQPRGQMAMVTKIVIVTVALYVADIFLGGDHWLMKSLEATPNSLLKPYLWWQLLSYGFAHDFGEGGEWHIIFNMFVLWMFGRDVETVYGRKEFLCLYLVAIVLGGVIWTARTILTVDPRFLDQMSMLGASGAVAAVMILFCLNFPNRQVLLAFFLPVPAWVVGVMIVLINLVGAHSGTGNVAYDVHLAGIVFALAYYRFGWRIERWVPDPSRWKGLLKRRPKLKVHNPGSHGRDVDSEADVVLDKVNRNGIESLTRKERKILEEYSRRMRQKHQ